VRPAGEEGGYPHTGAVVARGAGAAALRVAAARGVAAAEGVAAAAAAEIGPAPRRGAVGRGPQKKAMGVWRLGVFGLDGHTQGCAQGSGVRENLGHAIGHARASYSVGLPPCAQQSRRGGFAIAAHAAAMGLRGDRVAEEERALRWGGGRARCQRSRLLGVA